MKGAKRPDRQGWRRDGAIALALFLLPAVVALVLWRLHKPLDIATLVAVIVGLPTLWVAWATYRDSKRPKFPPDMAHVADQLAKAVGDQWSAEATVRRLNDPYPLMVSWASADPSLTGSWVSLVRLASSGAGWPPPPPPRTWAAGPDGLAGADRDLVEVLGRVPTGRLVVLGEPGAGKTMLMVRLVLDLLARRPAGGQVPILASVTSWNPADQDLRSWLEAQLVITYPFLAAAPPPGTGGPSQAAVLLASQPPLILPILDGLDEIPEQVRGSAIHRINEALRSGEKLVVTSRSQQYRDAVMPEDGVGVKLGGAAAVQLRPLDADDIRRYLCDAAAPGTKASWDPVLAVLGTDAPAGQALARPLMVGLARTIYNPSRGEATGASRDPVELCDPTLADRTAVESLLFDAFIPAAYRHDPDGRWKAQEAEKWLVFLAHHLDRSFIGPDLALWQLPLAVWNFDAIGGLLTAAAFDDMPSLGIAIPLVVAAFRGATESRAAGKSRVVGALRGVAALGPLARAGLADFLVDMVPDPPDIGSAASPEAALARGRRAAIVAGVVAMAVYGVAFRGSGLGHLRGPGRSYGRGCGRRRGRSCRRDCDRGQ